LRACRIEAYRHAKDAGVLQRLYLLPIGVAVGAYGTLIGAGGGFVLVPLLLFLYPDESPATITSISLAVVFFNALSGTVAYRRLKRIDYRTGALVALATVPGAMLGALTTQAVSRELFSVVFGTVLLGTAVLLIVRPADAPALPVKAGPGFVTRALTDAEGITHTYSFSAWLAEALGFGIGFLSGLSGSGGGVLQVPAFVRWLRFPPHIATATSQFIVAAMALSATVVHLVTGHFTTGLRRMAVLAIGVVVGAQVGAGLSRHMRSVLLLRLLGAALGLVGLRLVGSAVF
jgi:uncharacterized membrane protein YfcA